MTLEKQHYSITGTHNKIMMADLHLPVDSKPKAIIVYAHGINGFKDWGGMNLMAEAFAEKGYAFLKFNYSHSGTTPDNPEEFEDLEAYGNDNYSIRQHDLSLIFDFITSSERFPYDGEELALIGHSRGGTDAILFAAHDDRVDKLITWAAVAEARTPWRNWDSAKMESWKESGTQYLRNGRTGQQMPVHYQLYEDYRTNRDRLDVEKAARAIDKPWLIIHGDEDESVFVKDAYQLKQYQPQAQVAIIPQTGHTFDRSHPWTESGLPEASMQLLEKSLNFIKNS